MVGTLPCYLLVIDALRGVVPEVYFEPTRDVRACKAWERSMAIELR